MRTQGLLLSDMISLSLQGIERGAIEEAQLRGLNTAGLTPVSPAQVMELRSVAFAARTYAWPGVDPSVMERAYACSLSPCVMLGEAAWLHGMAGQLAKTDTRTSFEVLLQRSECDRESITRALRAPADLSQFKDLDLLDPLARVLEKL